MADAFLLLPAEDRREALSVAADRSGRPAHLLEKDVWVVWALATLYGSLLGEHLEISDVLHVVPHIRHAALGQGGGGAESIHLHRRAEEVLGHAEQAVADAGPVRPAARTHARSASVRWTSKMALFG